LIHGRDKIFFLIQSV